MKLRILHSDPNFVAVDKPYGIHVHPPEDEQHRIPKHQNGLALLRDQLGRYVYPVHRLDRSTNGVLIYALSSEAASALAGMFARQEIRKVYFALVRGHAADSDALDTPLAEEGKDPVAALTRFQTIGRMTLDWKNSRFETSRYSLLRVSPETGRFHQIRKHLRRANHPIIGDTVHGDGEHNRLWKNEVGRSFLFLKCYSLSFTSPFDGRAIEIASYWNPEWLRIFESVGTCPFESVRPLPRARSAPSSIEP